MKNTLIVCDIQREYDAIIPFQWQFVKYLNRSAHKFGKVLYFFNINDGDETTDVNDMIQWLSALGLTEKAERKIQFYEKEYGFLREAMDNGIEQKKIAQAVQAMQQRKIKTSEKLPYSILKETVGTNAIWWEPTIDIIEKETVGTVTLVGGLRRYCLKEIEICIQALNKPYELKDEFIFDI